MPCWNISACVNTVPGYQCKECPAGYKSTYEDALGWNITKRVFIYKNKKYAALQVQTCEDIDECALNNGGCDSDMQCINTVVRYFLTIITVDLVYGIYRTCHIREIRQVSAILQSYIYTLFACAI